ncbi:MAG: UDP-N-acetylmuramoyl-tripeptide--D-alanyl-D-alanine ligase [Halioglobus sp.]
MRPLRMSELVSSLQARLVGPDQLFTGVTTDSRSVQPGEIFVALRGQNFDGHEYLSQVAKSGAAGAVVSKQQDSSLSMLQVADTQKALGLIAAYNRALFDGPLVAITGSSGKTSVKNLISAVLAQRGKTLATEGNFNNEVGVPLTLLRLTPEHQFAVVEMGAGAPGDIAWLSELGRPTIAVVLNVMPAHLEGFGSLDAIAQTKGAIYDGLDESSLAIINADQPWADQWRHRAHPASILDFGLEQAAAISADKIISRGLEGVSFTAITPVGDIEIALAVPGKHNVGNALAAIAAGLACELSLPEIKRGLESVRPVGGRLSTRFTTLGTTVIDDCYNANPGSVRAAIDLLASCPGRRTLMLGAMRELGPDSVELHRQMGEYAHARGVERLWGVGPELAPAVQAFGGESRFFADTAEANSALPGAFDDEDTVLIKGSRGAQMERVLAAFDSVPARETN